MEKTGIRINGIFISSDKAKCPSENQVCCRKDKPPKTEFVEDNVICEENEGKVWHFYQIRLKEIIDFKNCIISKYWIFISTCVLQDRRKFIKIQSLPSQSM